MKNIELEHVGPSNEKHPDTMTSTLSNIGVEESEIVKTLSNKRVTWYNNKQLA